MALKGAGKRIVVSDEDRLELERSARGSFRGADGRARADRVVCG